MTDRKEEPKTIRQIAHDELLAEISREAKDKLKAKMKQLHQAEQVVKNLQRELDDLEQEILVKFDAL